MRCSIHLLTILLLAGLLAGCNNLTDLDAITRRSTEDAGREDESASGVDDADLANNNRVPSEDAGEDSAEPTDAAPGEDVDLPDVSEGEEVGEDVGMDTAPDADPPDVETPPVCTAVDLSRCPMQRCMVVTSCAEGACVYEPSASCTARGEVCAQGRECVVGACGSDGWCGGEGTPCIDNSSCIEGLVCLVDQCAAAEPTVQIDEMVFVPAGASLQGADGTQRVFVSAFYIDRTEVTVAAYSACVDAGECSMPSLLLGCRADGLEFSAANNWHNRATRGTHPINCVDWDQAAAYCAWAGKRLPTEAEWEKAARGADGRTYPWGEAAPTCELAVFDDGVRPGCGEGTTQPVGSKLPGASPYGGLDMSGNVQEWVQDQWVTQRNVDGARDPLQPEVDGRRVGRGGAWSYEAASQASEFRSEGARDSSTKSRGLRCAKGLP